MLLHNLIVAWRNLLKYKIPAGIGILGLAVGVLCFVLCGYYVRLLLGVDQEFPNHNRIAEVLLKDEKGRSCAGTPARTVGALTDKFPGKTVCFTSITYPWYFNVSFEQRGGKQAACILNAIETDRNFKDVFSCRLIVGNWEQIVRQKNAIVLSRTMARKVYGEENPLGKVLHPNEFAERAFYMEATPEELSAIDYVVMGVMEDLPVNASFSFFRPVDAVMLNNEYGLLANQKPQDSYTGCSTYVLLRPGVTCRELNKLAENGKYGVSVWGDMYVPDFLPAGKELRDDYLIISSLYLGIGGLILLVALLNFFTFLIGNFLNRLKEYQVRKGLGGDYKHLFGLLYTETLMYLIPVIILVFCLLELTYSRLDIGFGRHSFVFELNVLYWQLLEYLVFGVVLCACICLGISIWLSRQYIRGKLRTSGKLPESWGRNVMLGIQLMICSFFLTGSLAMYLQSVKVSNSLFPGLSKEEKENIVEIDLDIPQLKGRERLLIERLSAFPEVADVLQADVGLMSWRGRGATMRKETYFEYRILGVGNNFMTFLHMPLLSGQVFQHPAQGIGDPGIAEWIGQEALSKQLENFDPDFTAELKKESLNQHLEDFERPGFEICGLTEELPDIHRGGSMPVLWAMSEQPTCCYLKVYPGTRETVIQKSKALLGEYLPEAISFRIKTLQRIIEDRMDYQNKMRYLFSFFAITCILITILGVYSAITIDTERRRKEMAIRKINGASGWKITGLFVRLYVKLLGVAILVTFPLLSWGIQRWLEDYLIRFNYGFGFWLIVLLLMVIVVALTIAWKICEIIRINPVEILRNE